MAALVLAACAVRDPHCAVRPAFAPWDERAPAPPVEVAPARDLADGLVALYQRRLRAPRRPGEGCLLRPTCSEFARIALDRWRVLGLVLIADRLFVREHLWMAGSYPPVCDPPYGLSDPVP
jgi:putative component of membrane protein insertase Oxa1/YidC/SpoIIIJ protein YidD